LVFVIMFYERLFYTQSNTPLACELKTFVSKLFCKIDTLTASIDSSIAKVENTIQRLFRGITKDTSKIREWTARLVSEHIEKIRSQLIARVGN
jgi:hypothetical protein